MKDRWTLAESGIAWAVAQDAHLPHGDHVELSGRKLSVILRYGIDDKRRLLLSREVIWPTLRLKRDDVRGYLRRTWDESFTLPIWIDGVPLVPGPVRELRLWEGRLTITHEPLDGIAVQRHLFPSLEEPALLERWSIINFSDVPIALECVPEESDETVTCYDGEVVVSVHLAEGESLLVRPGEFGNVTVAFAAHRKNQPTAAIRPHDEGLLRSRRWKALDQTLTLTTPDPVLNTAFAFARWRAAESLFDTKLGLVHSPGGGRYYGGVWANDQAEYANPLFGYLGDPLCHEASVNCYRTFATELNSAFRPLPSSFEVEGDMIWRHCGDRGDAAMIASGASRYALARGDKAVAEELWPLIVWCLEYCRRKTDSRGVVLSDTDELEGRFPAGDANLSTSCLAYDGYLRAADLARELGQPKRTTEYEAAAATLAVAIEAHFGHDVAGFSTYRYYDGNTTLRAWICLPLVIGLASGARRDGTIAALTSPHLWTDDGLATESGDTVFWDRATLYALRGLFATGATELALEKLTAFSRRRLLGEHVPYPVEAHPEGSQAHLAAESALYCRIITEGLFGIVPRAFDRFEVHPHLPDGWPEMRLTLTGFGGTWEIVVQRTPDGVKTSVTPGP